LNHEYAKERFIGDLFHELRFAHSPSSHAIIGTDGHNYRDFVEMGNIAQVQVVRAEVVDSSTGAVLPDTGPQFVGVSHAVSREGVTYLFLPNLNGDGHPSRVRLYLRSENRGKFLKVTALNSNVLANEQVYPRSAVVNSGVPQKGAILLRIDNTDRDDTRNLPRSLPRRR
jgi:hypothetical protein